ncbi:MAG TPA: hypothetical protein VNZ58_03160 [Thermomicrobiales bacterium]|nr:hypothetical protein [Thermomicrobiales bacterium]
MDSEGQIKDIVLRRMHRCVVCHREFNPEDIQILSRKPDIWTMLVECDDCHARNFVAAVLNDGDPHEAQLALRRLTEQVEQLDDEPTIEPEGPVTGEPVSAGDVVDMYQFLNEFDGDFIRLFRS